MDYLMFYVAADRETGKIIENSFVVSGQYIYGYGLLEGEPHGWVRDHCDRWRLDKIDSDGPFWVPFWSLNLIRKKPKWGNNPPSRVTADKWAQRLKSTEELAAYRAGMKAARET